jgi:hypothetical protein
MLKQAAAMLGTVCLLTTVCVAQVSPQEIASPEKRALIKELLLVTNAQRNTNDIFNIMLIQMEASLPTTLKTMISNSLGLQGEELQQKIAESSARVIRRYKELLPQRINFAQEVEEISYAIYSKYYTEQELKDLITFYKTPTGRKVIAVMPQVMQESMQRSMERLMPQQMQLIQEIVQQELRNSPTSPTPPLR